MTSRSVRGALAAACAAALVLSTPTDAEACGACFHPQGEVGSSVVTDHRMVFKISTRETILWDQVRYSGSPSEFAWVLPVHEGARIELSTDEWIAALDAATRPTVEGPHVFCGGRGGGGRDSTPSSPRGGPSSSGSFDGDGDDNSGCGCSSETTVAESAGAASDGGARKSPSAGSAEEDAAVAPEPVEVVRQEVVGPYEAVTLHANAGEGIAEWLTKNGFAIPKEVEPTIQAYTDAAFDFIALRLRPGQGVRAMRPVRVVSPGADLTLPLRMVAAGAGARVGMTLWVIGEGRYRTKSFPEATLDWTELAWKGREGRSNLTELVAGALAQQGGRAWLTEAAIADSDPASFGMRNPPLAQAYLAACANLGEREVPCDSSALPPADKGDAGDAGADADAGSPDAGGDAGGTCTKVVKGCEGFDDLEVASRGLHPGSTWVTRLRADLPFAALGTDLTLEPAPSQVSLSPAHDAQDFDDPTFDPCTSARSIAPLSPAGATTGARDDGGGGPTCRTSTRRLGNTWVLVAATAFAVSRVLRRRR